MNGKSVVLYSCDNPSFQLSIDSILSRLSYYHQLQPCTQNHINTCNFKSFLLLVISLLLSSPATRSAITSQVPLNPISIRCLEFRRPDLSVVPAPHTPSQPHLRLNPSLVSKPSGPSSHPITSLSPLGNLTHVKQCSSGRSSRHELLAART